MVIYTPIPVDFLFNYSEDKARRFTEFPYGEARVVAEMSAEGSYRVVRVISSDPQDFLRPELQPGSVIVFKPVFA